MNMSKHLNNRTLTILLFLFLSISTHTMIQAQQKIGFGIHADPVISWFSSDIKEIKNDGARPGFNFGLTFNRYFSPNYSFSTGISLINAGGRLVSQDTTVMEFVNLKYKLTTVLPNEAVVYKIQYLSIPFGLKLQTNQVGYITFYSDLGFDPKVVIGGKADIPSLDIKGEKVTSELRMFNLSYHVSAGIEYSLGRTTALVFGLNFDNNFFDITKDNGDQPVDKVSNKVLSFRIGVNF
jgi:hypothetical protein